MIIDSHEHVCYHGYGADDVIAEMDQFGINVTWLLTWYLPPSQHVPSSYHTFNPSNTRPDGTHAGIVLNDVLEACRRYPDRFVPGYCPCPVEGDASALFENACRLYGVRVCGEWSYRMLLDDPRSLELFRTAGACGAPVVLHIDTPYLPGPDGRPVYQPVWYGGNLAALERALQACPDTVFIGHAPGFWRYISGNEEQESAVYPSGPIEDGGLLYRLFDTYPNLYADLSAGSGLGAMERDTVHAEAFLTRYADRLLFGRDDHGDALLRFLSTLNLPADVSDRILYKNALRLVPLE